MGPGIHEPARPRSPPGLYARCPTPDGRGPRGETVVDRLRNPAKPPGRFHVNGMASGSEPSPPLAGNLPVSRGTVAWPRRLGSNDEESVARAERSGCPGLHALLRPRVLMFWPSPRGAARRSVQPAGSNQQSSRWPASRGGAVEGPQAAARTPKSKHQWPAAPSGSAWIGPRRPPDGDHSHRRGAARVHGVTDRAAPEVVSARSAPLPAGPGDCTKAPPHGATHEQRVPGEPSLHRPALGDGKDASQARPPSQAGRLAGPGAVRDSGPSMSRPTAETAAPRQDARAPAPPDPDVRGWFSESEVPCSESEARHRLVRLQRGGHSRRA